MTGIGVKFTNSILSVTGDSLFLALVLTGLTSILLGMEVPTTAAYIVAVVVGGPVLVDLGVPAIAAHLFVFYLAILSAVTPPICGAIFIAAGMADANWVETAKFGLKLSFAAFLLPFLFTYEPSLVLVGSTVDIVWSMLKGFIAVTMFSAGFVGYLRANLKFPARLAMIFGGCLVLPHVIWLNLIGALILPAFWFFGRGPSQAGETTPNASKPVGP